MSVTLELDFEKHLVWSKGFYWDPIVLMVKVVYILSDLFIYLFCFPLYLDLMARIDAFVNICLWDPNLSR